MRAIIVFIAVLLLPALAWSATTYIDPSCTNNGDGTVGTPCAASGGAAGPLNAWAATVTGAADDQFLQKKGTTWLARIVINSSGTAGHPIIFGAYGTGAKPIIRSEENAANGTIQIGTDKHDITIDGLEIHGQLNVSGIQSNAIRNNTTAGSGSVVVNITVQNCTIGHIFQYDGLDDDDGVDIRGQGIIVQDNTFLDIANDAMNLVSDGAVGDVIIRRNTCSTVGQSGTNGDCYQVSGTSTKMLIEHNYCDHSDKDVKQCIVSNSDVDIRYNELHGFVGATVNTPIYCDGGQCRIYGNRAYHGRLCIQNYGLTGSTTYSNLCVAPATYGIEVAAPNGTAFNNTVDGIVEDTAAHNGFAAIRFTTAATNGIAKNNIVSGSYQGIRLASGSSQTETTNMFHGNVPTPVYDTTLGAGIAATNPTTATNQFVAATDYRLLGTSTARDAGIFWGGCTDIDGHVCDGTPDLGAYQYGSGDVLSVSQIGSRGHKGYIWKVNTSDIAEYPTKTTGTSSYTLSTVTTSPLGTMPPGSGTLMKAVLTGGASGGIARIVITLPTPIVPNAIGNFGIFYYQATGGNTENTGPTWYLGNSAMTKYVRFSTNANTAGWRRLAGWNCFTFHNGDENLNQGSFNYASDSFATAWIEVNMVAGQTSTVYFGDWLYGYYSKPKIIVWSADNDDSVYTDMFPYMQANNVKGSYVPWGLWLNSPSGGQLSVAQMQAMSTAGWAVHGHGYNIITYSSSAIATVEADIILEKAYLASINIPFSPILIPNGGAHTTAMDALYPQYGYVAGNNANVGSDQIGQQFYGGIKNPYNLWSVSVDSKTAAQAIAVIDHAISYGEHTGLLYHTIPGSVATLQDFKDVIDYLVLKRSQGVLDIVTWDELIANQIPHRRPLTQSRAARQ